MIRSPICSAWPLSTPHTGCCRCSSCPIHSRPILRLNGQIVPPLAQYDGQIDQLTVVIDTLRREGMSTSLIVDHLSAQYCPMVARDSRLLMRKRLRLFGAFRSGHKAVYSLESNLNMIIRCTAHADVVDVVNTIAKHQGLSALAWIEMTIDNALQQQSAARRQ